MEEDKNSGGVFDFMKDVLTFGFLSSTNEQKDKPLEHSETCQVTFLINNSNIKQKLYMFLGTYQRN